MVSTNNRSVEKLAKGSYFLVLDNVTNLSLGALFWVVLAKIVDPAAIGQAMVVNAFAMSVIGFAGFGVQVTISKYVSEYNAKAMPDASRRIFKLGIKLALIVSCSVGVILALMSTYISTSAYQNASLSLLLAFTVLTFLPSQTFVAALMGAYQGTQRMKYALITDLIYQIIRIAIAVALAIYGLGSFGILISFSVASVIAALLGYSRFIPRIMQRNHDVGGAHNEDSKENLRQIIKFSAHNYLAMGMKTLTAQIGVLVVGTQNFELAAFYGLSVLISNLVGGILMAVSRAILPTATEEWTKGNKNGFRSTLSSSVRLSLLVSGFGFIILMIEPSQVLGLISDAYLEASLALRILVVSSIIGSLGAIMMSMLNAANRASDVAKIGSISALSTIALTFILTPFIDIEGAAIAVLAGSVVSLALSVWILKRKENLTFSTRSVLRPTVCIAIGLGTAFCLIFILHFNTIIALVVGLLAYTGFLLAYRVTTRTELRTLLSIVRKSR